MKGKKLVMAVDRFDGIIKESDLVVEEEEIPQPKDGEILCETVALSVDPYMRPYSIRTMKKGNVFLNNYVLARVKESKNSKFSEGALVVGPFGCRTHVISKGEQVSQLDIGSMPPTYGLGILGMPGMTSYFGFLEICQPKAGETVYVNSAAGAVGSAVGQIAKLKGCRVVGSAGSDKKVQYLKEIGFDDAFNYKTSSLDEALKRTCPSGIDCFFDNVGGAGFVTVLANMNLFGRVAVCGSIATYNEVNKPLIPEFNFLLLSKQLKIEGFIVTRWQNDYPRGRQEMIQWLQEGKIKYREHVTEGFENFPKALIELFTGDNFGKAVVKV